MNYYNHSYICHCSLQKIGVIIGIEKVLNYISGCHTDKRSIVAKS